MRTADIAMRENGTRRPSGGYAVALALTLLAFVVLGPLALLVLPQPAPVIQLLLGALLVVLSLGADSQAEGIPAIIRPAPIAFGSLTIASISASSLGEQVFPEYLLFWVIQALGMGVGFFLAPNLTRLAGRSSLTFSPERYTRLAQALWFLFLLAALAFFATQGVPALQTDLEQARVDAAEGGTGFIRMFAFLLPTITAALIAIKGWRSTWVLAAVALVIMLGYGNRVPFIYFAFPLAVMVAVTTRKLGSGRIIGIAALLVALMGALAAWRVYNTPDMASSHQYREAVAREDNLQIAWLAISHYARVVPDNAMMVKGFVDSGALPLQFGSTYLTLFASALPGRQISPDMMLKELNGVQFIGGGIPPTLAGEGYMNFGLLGVFLNALLAMLLLRYWAGMLVRTTQFQGPAAARIVALIYGYVLTWICLAQISGFAGSATVSLAGFLVLLTIRWISLRRPNRVHAPAYRTSEL